jgi:hypothetical protein
VVDIKSTRSPLVETLSYLQAAMLNIWSLVVAVLVVVAQLEMELVAEVVRVDIEVLCQENRPVEELLPSLL